jgi:hypothetical protein
MELIKSRSTIFLKTKQVQYLWLAEVGIGIRKSNAGIGIPASVVSFRYRTKKMPD